MTGTSWLTFSDATLTTTVELEQAIMPADLEALHIRGDVTILTVLGRIHVFVDASAEATDAIMHFGLRVTPFNLTVAETPPLSATTAIVDDGFWLWTNSRPIWASDADDRVYTIEVETHSKRVVRPTETLALKVDFTGVPSGGVFLQSEWRVLVLHD